MKFWLVGNQPGYMAQILAMLKNDLNFQLTDLGSNIGEFMLMAAALALSVQTADNAAFEHPHDAPFPSKELFWAFGHPGEPCSV